jgi:hypothetical protein
MSEVPLYSLSSEEGTPYKLKDLNLKSKARIWPWQSHMCRIFSTATVEFGLACTVYGSGQGNVRKPYGSTRFVEH